MRLVTLRVLALVGLTFASLLLADDLSRVPSFCPFQTGCAAVTTSQFGRPLGIPLSAVGLAAFGLFLVLTLSRSWPAARLVDVMAVAAGTAGLLLVALQWFVLRRTCQFCLVVDVVAMLLAAVALGWPRRPETVCASRRLTWAWPLVALGGAGVPLLWSALRPSPEVPLEVQRAWWVGKVNLVEITDFTCPYCRATHAALEDLRHNDPEALHFVRFLAPAPGDEPGWAAARAYHCALRQAAGQRVAHALFTTNDYSPENLREIARQAGLDAARYDADWSDLSIDREIELTRQWVGRLGSTGVPQVWVQDILLFGEQTPASLRSAIRRARLREQPTAVGQPLAPMLN